jgi:transposase-like protein
MGRLKDEVGESILKNCFKQCPFCSEEDSMEKSFGFRRSSLLCHNCQAKWFLHYSMAELVGAELVNPNVDGKGKDLLQREYKPEFWRRMALKKTNTSEESSNNLPIREIIKEKEVIVKVRCPYCKHAYVETLEKCPNCGASC